jgi:MoaA/NifB/PqqE/SkfB family radical SAM enzyme
MPNLQQIYANFIKDNTQTYKDMFADAIINVDTIKEFLSCYKGEEYFLTHLLNYANEFCADKTEIYLEFAKYYLGVNKQKAVSFLEKYVAGNGRDNNALLLLVKLYREEKNYQKAYEIMKITDGATAEHLHELLHLHLACAKYSEIELLVDKLLEQKQFLHEVTIEPISKIYIQHKNYSKLLKLLEHNSLHFDKNEKLIYYLYLCNLNNGNIAEAFQELFTILTMDVNANSLKREDIYDLFINLINQNKNSILSSAEFMRDVILKLCILIDADDTNGKLIETLSVLLRHLPDSSKEKISNILYEYYQKSKKPRAKNIFLSEYEILQKKTNLQSRPRQVIISLTTKCNLKCPMCCVFDQPVYNVSNNFLNFIKNNMQYMERIIWQGGEVFLYDGFDELVELAGCHNVAQDALTNGLLLNSRRLEKISKYKFHLKLSIDAVEKNLYEQIRLGGSFEKLMEVVSWLKNNNLNKYSRTDFIYTMAPTIMSVNYKQIDKMVNFALDNGFQSIAFQRYVANAYDKNAFALNDTQVKFVLERISYYQNQYKNNKLPVKIETNFALDDINSLLKPHGTAYTGNTDINENLKHINNENKLDSTKPKSEKAFCATNNTSYENSLFCVAPWLKVYFDINGILRFACNSDPIDVNKYPHEQIWNCPEILEYRQHIAKNSFKLCNMLCYNSGEYGERTKLGIL